MNAFDIAILRILIKRNGRILAIHKLIDGFPDGSENSVIAALMYLIKVRYVIILPGITEEEQLVVRNGEKLTEIIKILENSKLDSRVILHNSILKFFNGEIKRMVTKSDKK